MDRRSRALESSGDQPEVSTPKTTPTKMHQEAYSSTVEHSASCQMKECCGSHSFSQCNRYKQLGTREKKAVVRKIKRCMNLLGRHFLADCPSKFSCCTYNGRNHTSLHFDRPVEQQNGVTNGTTFSGPSVLLSTAIVGIDDAAGETLMFRALLDSGSQTSFITASAASNHNIARSTVDVKISGIDGRQQAAKESVNLVIGPQKLPVIALVLNSIAGNLPFQSINLKQLKSMKNVALANDPSSEGLESPKHKILICPLQLKLFNSAICIIHGCFISNCISTSANHVFNEAETSWPAGCWRMTSL